MERGKYMLRWWSVEPRNEAGAWSQKVENEWSELGATKGKMAGVLSANDGWSSERFLKMAWSLERRPQKGSELGAIFTPAPPPFTNDLGYDDHTLPIRAISSEFHLLTSPSFV